MSKNKQFLPLYKLIRWLIWLFYPKIEAIGLENLPNTPAVIAANHCQMNGPIACELYFPGNRYIWTAGQMMHLNEVPDYAFQDFWSEKPKTIRWFYRILSYIIAPLSVLIFNNAPTIGVYRDSRIISTFKTTVKRLEEGNHIVIFPEHDQPHNHIVCTFQDRFIDVAKLYYKKTGKQLAFIPLYIAPHLKKMYFGKPILFQPDASIEEERKRICTYLMDSVTQIACSLPEHTVVPYRNISKKDYPTNLYKEVSIHENTGS